jgi:queuine/archaeosine tRNA-ribosyltransferase
MIDSGGFALMNSPNMRWTVRSVGDLMENIEADVFVSLDFPPHVNDDKASRRKKIRASAKNFAVLTDRFPHKTIMPVIHGRTIDEIKLSIAEVVRLNKSPTWVGLGGIVPLLQNRLLSEEISALGAEVFIGRALGLIRNSFPTVRIHAFGAGGPRTFPAVFALGADSGDSIGWRQAAGFGSVFLPLKTQRAVIWNRSKGPPRKTLDESDLAQIDLCRCPSCILADSTSQRVALMKRSFYFRAIHNAWTITNQYRYWPKTRFELRSLLRGGGLGENWARAVD